MLTEFIYQWNPFNLYGVEVDVEDLICNPLKSNETLRQDCVGHCRRIQAPSLHSSLWERFVFWLRIYLNEKGHLEAIDKILSHFYKKLIQNPPQIIEKLQEFNFQAEKLRSLKNDYGFVYLKEGNPAIIESRLNEIIQYAYSIFADYQGKQALEEEEARKQAFLLFQENIEQKLEQLDAYYIEGLQRARLMSIATPHCLQILLEERAQSLQSRFKIIQDIEQQMNEIEIKHKGKFTIPSIEDYFYRLRARVCNEVRKIGIEAENIIGNLIINYRIGLCKDEIQLLFCSLEIDPEKMHMSESKSDLFCEELKDEINRIQRDFKYFVIKS